MTGAKKILILNGPNLNLLGKRQPEVYGSKTFEDYFVELKKQFSNLDLHYFQSNVEGELINHIQDKKWNGIVLNAGGYTHTSVSIRDAISAVETPVVEVHISNIAKRETFRHESLITPVVTGCVFGFGLRAYELALNYFEGE
jgi:3-dehydroquinate dehydratase-2